MIAASMRARFLKDFSRALAHTREAKTVIGLVLICPTGRTTTGPKTLRRARLEDVSIKKYCSILSLIVDVNSTF